MKIVKTRKPKTAPKLKQPYISPDGIRVLLTDSQKEFTDAALQAKDSSVLIQRTMEIYETNLSSARVIARQNFSKPNIMEYLGDRGYKALDVLNEAMTDKKASWTDRIKAADSLADRQFGKAMQRQEVHTTGVTLTIDLTSSLSGEQG